MRRVLAVWTLLLLALLLVVAGGGAASAASEPVGTPVTSVPAVGPLFFPSVLGLFPEHGDPHFCTASVVDSTTRDLLVTAAHCVYGTGATIEFAPGYHDKIAPAGYWDVRTVYIDPAWKAHRDPRDDVAILRVAPQSGRQVQDVVGGRPLGTPTAGAPVTVVGYPMGTGGEPLTCTNTLYDTDGFPSFDCSGYVDGTSGGPWIQAGAVVGVVGGYEQGGCSGATSYTAPFGANAQALLQKAESGAAGSVAPVAFFANDC